MFIFACCLRNSPLLPRLKIIVLNFLPNVLRFSSVTCPWSTQNLFWGMYEVVLQFMGSQRVPKSWTRLSDWSDLIWWSTDFVVCFHIDNSFVLFYFYSISLEINNVSSSLIRFYCIQKYSLALSTMITLPVNPQNNNTLFQLLKI